MVQPIVRRGVLEAQDGESWLLGGIGGDTGSLGSACDLVGQENASWGHRMYSDESEIVWFVAKAGCMEKDE